MGGGKPFSINGWSDSGNPFTIIGIRVWYGEARLRGIEVETSIGAFGKRGRTTNKAYGMRVGQCKQFDFNPDEAITTLSLWGDGIGSRSGAIKFLTNQEREFFVKMNKDLGEEFVKPVGSGMLVGIHGHAGADIDNLGFYFIKTVKSRKLTRLEYPTLSALTASVVPKIFLRPYTNGSDVAQNYTFQVDEEVEVQTRRLFLTICPSVNEATGCWPEPSA